MSILNLTKMVMLLLSVSLFPKQSLADTFVNICNRGKIGDLIAYQLNEASCSSVSTQKMAASKMMMGILVLYLLIQLLVNWAKSSQKNKV